MDLGKIQIGSIQVVGREGSKVSLQCLKQDFDKLPVKGIASGSDCLILDALDTENNFYIFNKIPKQDGKWYAI